MGTPTTRLARLDEIAELLGLALRRAERRKTDARRQETSTGLPGETERVLTLENGS
jgi:hypothetical protein